VALPAFLNADGRRHAVRLADLSSGGARVNCPAVVATGTPVTLDCGTLTCAAVVRWQHADQVGLCFDTALDANVVSALIERSSALASWINTRR
jgi:hypothetical protein